MSGWMRLVWRYVSFHWGKSLVLVLCLFLTAFLPIAVAILLRQFSRQIVARADATEAVVGPVGSGLDLALHALYFSRPVERTVAWQELESIRESGLARAIPLFSRFTARKFPIVGTSPDYLAWRQLQLRDGRGFLKLGECVLGARVAEQLGLGTGDSLLSDRENVIDLAGLYPLKLKVCGVLAAAESPDDGAVFVDVKTAWVIQGLGHGHQELSQAADDPLVLGREGNNVVASAAVLPYTEITPQNIASFHFHGDPASFPLTAILLQFPDEKSATVLMGRYPSRDGLTQLVVPRQAIDELLGLIFQTERFFQANSLLIAASTTMLMGLVILLSLRLRQPEMATLYKIGCSRSTLVLLQLGELMFVLAVATVLLVAAIATLQFFAGDLVRQLILGS